MPGYLGNCVFLAGLFVVAAILLRLKSYDNNPFYNIQVYSLDTGGNKVRQGPEITGESVILNEGEGHSVEAYIGKADISICSGESVEYSFQKASATALFLPAKLQKDQPGCELSQKLLKRVQAAGFPALIVQNDGDHTIPNPALEPTDLAVHYMTLDSGKRILDSLAYIRRKGDASVVTIAKILKDTREFETNESPQWS